MKYEIIISSQAKDDISQAAKWYEQRQKRLSQKFMISLKNSFKTLKENPFAFAVVYMQIRKTNIKIFPYSIFFEIDKNTITIFAIIHSSRSQKNWQKRIK